MHESVRKRTGEKFSARHDRNRNIPCIWGIHGAPRRPKFGMARQRTRPNVEVESARLLVTRAAGKMDWNCIFSVGAYDGHCGSGLVPAPTVGLETDRGDNRHASNRERGQPFAGT